MTFAEHAVAQVLREVAAELEPLPTGHGVSDPVLKWGDLSAVLNKIAQRLSPKPPGEK